MSNTYTSNVTAPAVRTPASTDLRLQALETRVGTLEAQVISLEAQVSSVKHIDTSMVDQFLVFLKQVKPDVVRDFHIWLEAKKKVGG